MSHRSFAFAVLVAWGFIYIVPGDIVPGDRRANAQERVAKPDEVVRDQVEGAMAHGRGDRQWRRVIGRVKVLDAHTLEYADGTRIVLDITVPHPEQMALAGDVLYSAGQEAAAHLRMLVGDKRVMCIRDATGEGPWSAYVSDTNVERAMVVGGWALADHSSLHGDEIIARENKRGLWRGKFLDFDDWWAGVRLPGEKPPAKLTDERQAKTLLRQCGSSEPACALLVDRIIQDLPGTQRLVFPTGSYVTDEVLAQLPRLTKLEELSLLDTGRVSDAGLVTLTKMPGLKRLGFPHSGTDAGMEHVGNCKQLEALTIAWSNVTDAGFRHLARLSRLRRLSVAHAKITDAGLAHLSGLKELEVLGFYEPSISDAAMAHLRPLTKLKYLDIGNSEVTDAGVLQLIGLKNLRTLLVPDRVTKATRNRLQEAIPGLKFDGRPDEIP